MRGEPASGSGKGAPLLYYRTREQIAAYRAIAPGLRLEWLLEQMEFFDKAMPFKSKGIRERLFGR